MANWLRLGVATGVGPVPLPVVATGVEAAAPLGVVLGVGAGLEVPGPWLGVAGSLGVGVAEPLEGTGTGALAWA
jgi:hypothetical protein